jgi:hypothetical protein
VIACPIPYVARSPVPVCRCLNQSKGGGGKPGLVGCPRDERMIGPVKVSPKANRAGHVMRKETGNRPPLAAGRYLHGSGNGKPSVRMAGDHRATGNPVTA